MKSHCAYLRNAEREREQTTAMVASKHDFNCSLWDELFREGATHTSNYHPKGRTDAFW